MEGSKLKNLPVGTKVILDAKYDGETINWIVVHKNGNFSKIYPKESVLLMTKDIITIKAFDGKETNTRYFFNSEREFGSNDWSNSCVRKWLNTYGECQWQFNETSAPHSENVVYNAYEKELGFLSSFSNEVINNMIPVSVICSRKSSMRETKDLVFAPSKTEIGLRCKDKEGETFEYFKGFKKRKRRIAYPNYKAIERAEKTFIDDFQYCDEFHPWNYMLRSIDDKAKMDFCRIATVNPTGKIDSSFAFSGWTGVRPVICVSNNTEVSVIE